MPQSFQVELLPEAASLPSGEKKKRKKKRQVPRSFQVELLLEVASPATTGDVGVSTQDEGRHGSSDGSSGPFELLSSEALPERTDPYTHERSHGVQDACDSNLTRARQFVEKGRVQEAVGLYMRILEANSSNLTAHNELGLLLDELKQYDVALGHFEAAELLAPDDVEILTNYASTLTSVARYEEAEVLLRRAQELLAEDIDVRREIGILYFRRGLYLEAEVELSWVCAQDKENGLAFYYMGEALNRLSRFDEAMHAMDQAVKLLPNDPRVYYTLGHLYDRSEMPVAAANMYRRARQLQSS